MKSTEFNKKLKNSDDKALVKEAYDLANSIRKAHLEIAANKINKSGQLKTHRRNLARVMTEINLRMKG